MDILQRACLCEIVLLATNRRGKMLKTLSYAPSTHEHLSCHPHISHLPKRQCGHLPELLRTLLMWHAAPGRGTVVPAYILRIFITCYVS